MTARILAGTSVCAFLLLAGCGGKIVYPNYYALDLPRPPQPAAIDPHLRGTAAVRRFDVPTYLRQGRIVYRRAPEEIGFYYYHRWAADPAVSVTDAVIDALRASQVFSIVKRYGGESRQEYLLSGRIDRLEEIDYDGVRVEARLSAELLNLRTGATIWTGDADETLPVGVRNVNAVVVEMTHAVRQTVDRLVASLNEQLAAKACKD